jgi:hypothetical protein
MLYVLIGIGIYGGWVGGHWTGRQKFVYAGVFPFHYLLIHAFPKFVVWILKPADAETDPSEIVPAIIWIIILIMVFMAWNS